MTRSAAATYVPLESGHARFHKAAAVSPFPASQVGSTDQHERDAGDLVPVPPHKPRELLQLLREADTARFNAVLDCGTYYTMAHCGCGRRVLPRTCGDRLCPGCERRRAAKAVKRYACVLEGWQWVRFVTLTVRRHSLGELAVSIKRIRKWFRALRAKFPEFFAAGVYSIETKGKRAHRGDRGGWHTHVHALAAGTGLAFVRQQELKAAWIAITKGRGTVLHVEAPRKSADGTWANALRECLKYVTKGTQGDKRERDEEESIVAGWTAAMVREFYAATKNARLFQTFGDAARVRKLPPCPCERCGEAIRPEEGHAASHLLTYPEARAYVSARLRLGLAPEDADRYRAARDAWFSEVGLPPPAD